MCEASNKRNVDLDPMSLAELELRSFLDMPVWMDDESESEIPVFSVLRNGRTCLFGLDGP